MPPLPAHLLSFQLQPKPPELAAPACNSPALKVKINLCQQLAFRVVAVTPPLPRPCASGLLVPGQAGPGVPRGAGFIWPLSRSRGASLGHCHWEGRVGWMLVTPVGAGIWGQVGLRGGASQGPGP